MIAFRKSMKLSFIVNPSKCSKKKLATENQDETRFVWHYVMGCFVAFLGGIFIKMRLEYEKSNCKK